MGPGPGKTVVGPGKVGPGPSKTVVGPGKVGPGPGKTLVGPGKMGPGPGRTIVGPGKMGPGPGKTVVGPGKMGPGPGKTVVGPGKMGPGPGKTLVGPGKVGPGPGRTVVGPGKVGPGPGKIVAGPGKIRPGKTVNVTVINKRNVSVFRERRRIWVGGIWRSFVPIVALSGLYVGSQYYDPDGYVALARPYCSGVSEEGYSLRWQEVPVEDGGTEWQCVQFRPRLQAVDLPAPPPPQTLVTPVPAPPQPTGSCEITVYSEPNFGGMSSPATENLATLEEAGWKNEIASVQVIAGTWEFYAEDEFTGDSMRLPPGSHGDLGEWTKRIASLMCIEPSVRARLSGN